MYCDYMFPFRLEKEVGMGLSEDGSNSEVYMKVDLKGCKKEITEEKYNIMHKNFIEDLAKQFNCDQKYIVPITGYEYEENTKDSEDDE